MCLCMCVSFVHTLTFKSLCSPYTTWLTLCSNNRPADEGESSFSGQAAASAGSATVYWGHPPGSALYFCFHRKLWAVHEPKKWALRAPLEVGIVNFVSETFKKITFFFYNSAFFWTHKCFSMKIVFLFMNVAMNIVHENDVSNGSFMLKIRVTCFLPVFVVVLSQVTVLAWIWACLFDNVMMID